MANEDSLYTKDDLLTAIAAVLMAIARADGRVDPSETQEILSTLIREGKQGYRLTDLKEILALAVDLSRQPEFLQEAVELIASHLPQERRNEMLLLAKRIAYADGVVTGKEREQIVGLAKELL